MESAAVAAVCREKLVRFLSVRVISDDAHTDLPREVASVIAHGELSRGCALRAVWQRPSSVKDFWKLYEHALEAADRLAKVRFLVSRRTGRLSSRHTGSRQPGSHGLRTDPVPARLSAPESSPSAILRLSSVGWDSSHSRSSR